jgi:hypothetical protein
MLPVPTSENLMPSFNNHSDRASGLESLRLARPTLRPELVTLADDALAAGAAWSTAHADTIRLVAAASDAAVGVTEAAASVTATLRIYLRSITLTHGPSAGRLLASDLGGRLPSSFVQLRPEERAQAARELLLVTATRPGFAGDAAMRGALEASLDALELAVAVRREASQRERAAHDAAASARDAWDGAWLRLLRVARGLRGRGGGVGAAGAGASSGG